MAIETYGVIQIGGPIGTVAEVEEFAAKAREFGATGDTVLVNGFLSIEFVGTPKATSIGGYIQAILPLVAYIPDGQ